MVARDGSGAPGTRRFVIVSEPDSRDAPVENDALNASLEALSHVPGRYNLGGRYTSRRILPEDDDDEDVDDEDLDDGRDYPTDGDDEECDDYEEYDDDEDDDGYEEHSRYEDVSMDDESYLTDEDDDGDYDAHEDYEDYSQYEDISMDDESDHRYEDVNMGDEYYDPYNVSMVDGEDNRPGKPVGAQDSEDDGSYDSYDSPDSYDSNYSMSEEWVHPNRGRERGRGRGRGRGQAFRDANDSGSSPAKGDRTFGEWRGGSNRGSRGGAYSSSQRERGDNQRARGSGRGDRSNQSNASSSPSQSHNAPAYPPKSSKPIRRNSLFISDDTSSEGGGAEEDESEETQSSDNGNDPSSTNANSGAALAAFEKRINKKWIQLKADREFERTIAIANGIIADPEKKTTLENAIKPVGQCEDMCPEYERAERIVQKTVDKCEKPFSRSGKDKLPDERLMVKKFRRSAAGVDEQLPTDLRTPAALKRSTDYLIDRILGGSQPFALVHKFVWDRTRAIRNDITILQFTNPADVRIAIYCLERIARFHILALHKLSPEYEDEEFNAYQEREQLNSTLVALRNLYDDNRNREVSPNEAEFRAYSIMLDSSPNIEDQVQGWPRHLLKDAQVHLALKFHALRQNAADRKGPLVPGARPNIAQENFGGYFQLLKTPAVSYLMACVAEMFFNEVREMGLRNLIDGYKRRAAHDRVFTRKDLMLAFAFDSEDETQEFAEAHGIYFGVPAGPEWVHFAASNFVPDSNPARRQAFSDTYVEYKNYNRTLPEVIHAVKVADSVNFGMYDHGSDQAMGDDGALSPGNSQSTRHDAGGPSSAPNSPPFQPSNNPVSRPPFGFNPSSTSSVPPTAASPFQASPSFGVLGTEAPATSATVVSPFQASPSFGVLGAEAPATSATAASALSSYPVPPSPRFETPGSAALGSSFPPFSVPFAPAPSNPFPSFGDPGLAAPSATFLASGPAAASSGDPKTKHVSFADSHSMTGPSQPPSTSFPSLARPTSVLAGGLSSQSPGASNSLPKFNWPNPTPFLSNNSNVFPAPIAVPAAPPTSKVTPPSSFTPGVPSPTTPRVETKPSNPPLSSQFPSNSFGSFTSQPPAPPSLLSGAPTQPPGSPFPPFIPPSHPSGPPSQPSGSPSQPSRSPSQPSGPLLHPSGPLSQPPGPLSRPTSTPLRSSAEIKKQQDEVFHQVVSTYFVQNNGVFEQLVEAQATPIIEDVIQELHQERVTQKWQKIRGRYLALKYGRLWRMKAYVMFRQRTSRDRRERMRKLREAGIKQRREALEKQKAREVRQAAKAAKAADTNGFKEVRVRKESHTPLHLMAQSQTSPPGEVSSEPNRKRNHITFSEQVRMLNAVKDALQPEKAEERRRHKRAKTLENPHPQREGFHDDGIEYERMPNGSWTRKIHNPWARKHKLNWTKTDYFKCKAMGIDPNTPIIPPSFRTLEKMNEKKRAADDGADAPSPTNMFQKDSSNGRRTSGSQIVDNNDDNGYSTYTPQRNPSPERNSWSPDEDPILMESRRLRALMAEDEAAMRAERLAYEKEQNEASMKRLRPAPHPSNGHGSPSSRQPRPFVPTISRTEQRIARTGAHGLAYKPVNWNKPSPGPPRRPPHPQFSFSQPSFGDDSDYENNGNGGGSYGMSGASSQGPSAAATPTTGVDGTSADNAFCLDSD